MQVIASAEARDFVRTNGGQLFVWLQKGGWASCGVTLRTATEPQRRRDFSRVAADGFELYVSSGLQRHLPDELHLVLRGLLRKHVTAYWNGLPWVRM